MIQTGPPVSRMCFHQLFSGLWPRSYSNWQPAAQDDAGAMVGIGCLYANGDGVEEQDLNKAMGWFVKAQAHGADVTQQMTVVTELRNRQTSFRGIKLIVLLAVVLVLFAILFAAWKEGFGL